MVYLNKILANAQQCVDTLLIISPGDIITSGSPLTKPTGFNLPEGFN